LQSRDAYPPDQNDGSSSPSSGGGPGDGGRNSGGPSGGDRRLSKRKDAGSRNSPSKKGKKKARKTSGGDRTGDCGEVGGELICSFWSRLRLFQNVDFPPGVLSQNGQSKRREIVSSTRTPDDDAPMQDVGWDNSDLEGGRSECLLECNPHFTNRSCNQAHPP
jgi:hypothetical protein